MAEAVFREADKQLGIRFCAAVIFAGYGLKARHIYINDYESVCRRQDLIKRPTNGNKRNRILRERNLKIRINLSRLLYDLERP